MYADDIVLISDSIRGLQRHINTLQTFCEVSGMNVNLKKTKVVVFKNGGRLSKYEKWYLDGEKIECVSYYKYLGLLFSTRNICSKAINTLVIQAEKTSNIILSSLRSIGEASFDIYAKVFDCMILPTLSYGAEIWGGNQFPNIERVQINYFKRYLGVTRRAPGPAVLGDCGRHSIFSHTVMKYIKFWLKIIRLPNHRYTKKCYIMLRDLDSKGKKTWATNVRSILQSYGFGYVWLNQEVANESYFVKFFKQRVLDIDSQNWESKIYTYDKLDTYCHFKKISRLNIMY